MKYRHPIGIFEVNLSDEWQGQFHPAGFFQAANEAMGLGLEVACLAGNSDLGLEAFWEMVFRPGGVDNPNVTLTAVENLTLWGLPTKRTEYRERINAAGTTRGAVKLIARAQHFFAVVNLFWRLDVEETLVTDFVSSVVHVVVIHDIPLVLAGDSNDDDGVTEEPEEEEDPDLLAELATLIKDPLSVRELSLARRYLTKVPSVIGRFENLEVLTLADNFLSDLPELLLSLSKLRTLDISNCRLYELPDWLGGLRSLEEVNLQANRISVLPASFGNLSKLTALRMGGNAGLGRVPDELATLSQLRELSLYNCGISEVPAWLFEKRSFRSLDFHSNKLQSLPEEIGEQKDLVSLQLGHNRISRLPDRFEELESLECLDLKDNPFTVMPAALSRLSGLRTLSMSSCGLTVVPEWVGRLCNLESLSLENNSLSTLPSSVGDLKNLKRLALEGNDFRDLPACLAAMDHTSIGISQKYRALFSTIAYRAVDPSVPITDEQLYARFDADLDRVMSGMLASPQWGSVRSSLRQVALRGAGLRSRPTDSPPVLGASKLGGLPDLPLGAEYPAAANGSLFTFLAQLNLQELRPFCPFFPPSGFLWFFVDDQESCAPAVIYSDCTSEDLVPFSIPEGVELFDSDMTNDLYRPCGVECAAFPSFPYFYSVDFVLDLDGAEALRPHVDFLSRCQIEAQPFADMPSGNDVHRINSYLFTQHESPQALAAKKFGGLEKDWIVILALSHDKNTGFCFWDAGTLYFLAHRDDVANRNFSNIFCGIESS